MKISNESHAVRMAERRIGQLSRVAPKVVVKPRKGGPPFNDGFDQVRLDNAKFKRESRYQVS